MATPPRHVPRDSSHRRFWVYIAVAAFIAVDVLLIAMALESTRAGEESESAQAANAYGAADDRSIPSSTPMPTATIAASVILPVPPARLLSAVDEQTAWRAVSGDCPATPAAPQLTTDGGATWKVTDATGPAGVTALQGLFATSESTVEVVGLAEVGCAPLFVKTFVGGDSFKSYPEQLDRVWYVNQADRASVRSPAGDAKVPCDSVVALAARDERSAAALCADGSLFATADAATWSPATSVPGVVSITYADTGYLAAAVGRPECAGVQLLTITATLESTEAGCFETVEPPASLAGNVAVSGAAGTVWLWAGDALVRSVDEGANWE